MPASWVGPRHTTLCLFSPLLLSFLFLSFSPFLCRLLLLPPSQPTPAPTLTSQTKMPRMLSKAPSAPPDWEPGQRSRTHPRMMLPPLPAGQWAATANARSLQAARSSKSPPLCPEGPQRLNEGFGGDGLGTEEPSVALSGMKAWPWTGASRLWALSAAASACPWAKPLSFHHPSPPRCRGYLLLQHSPAHPAWQKQETSFLLQSALPTRLEKTLCCLRSPG